MTIKQLRLTIMFLSATLAFLAALNIWPQSTQALATFSKSLAEMLFYF